METQQRIDFDAIDTPIAPSVSPLARHASYLGALSGQERMGRQCLALLTLYVNYGPLTDAEAALAMGIERTTVNARRNELVRRGLVEAVDLKVNPRSDVKNVRWCVKRG